MTRRHYNFVSTVTFEPWDFTTPLVKGIGGSETSHVEMSERLCTRGNTVRSWAPVPFEGYRFSPAGVPWSSCLDVDLNSPGIWVIYREPRAVLELPEGAISWLICQDVDYPRHLNKTTASRFTRIVALCEEHAAYLRKTHPYAADKVCVSSNGIRVEMLQKIIEANKGITRNPRRLMYASSPDRGLWYLVDIFRKAREVVEDLELHVCYGFQNVEKIASGDHLESPYVRDRLVTLKGMLESTPGIILHDRLNQEELAIEWLKTGIWCHPSTFAETSCITCMEAQALGAIPITNPTWAIGENVRFGVFIDGSPEDNSLVRARYTWELIQMAMDPERQEAIRDEMSPATMVQFNWDCFVEQWEEWADQDMALSSSPATVGEEVAA